MFVCCRPVFELHGQAMIRKPDRMSSFLDHTSYDLRNGVRLGRHRTGSAVIPRGAGSRGTAFGLHEMAVPRKHLVRAPRLIWGHGAKHPRVGQVQRSGLHETVDQTDSLRVARAYQFIVLDSMSPLFDFVPLRSCMTRMAKTVRAVTDRHGASDASRLVAA